MAKTNDGPIPPKQVSVTNLGKEVIKYLLNEIA